MATRVAKRLKINDIGKIGNKKKILKSSEKTRKFPVSFLEINFWQRQSQGTRKQISKFSGLVQLFLIFLLFANDFFTDCSLRLKSFKISHPIKIFFNKS